eukprot:431899-Prymnesium_polylepis.1
MADSGSVPVGLPSGLSETEKKLWLAIYMKARELINSNDAGDVTVRSAVDDAINLLTERGSSEFRFGMGWSKSVKSCLTMKQDFCSIRVPN